MPTESDCVEILRKFDHELLGLATFRGYRQMVWPKEAFVRGVLLESFGAADELRLAETADPVDRAGWVTVELKASALNWHDVLVRQGRYKSPLPHILGADGAGVRTDTGEAVVVLPSIHWGDRETAPGGDWEILGDRVRGTYAELVSVPVECLAPKPESYSWAEAAALPLVGVTTYRALVSRGRLTAGESILIVGAGGGVSTMALALAQGIGATVHVTGSSRSKLDRVKEIGADDGVLHTDDGWPENARALSPGGEGFDVILDPVGLWSSSIRALRKGGRLVVLGANVAEQATIDIRHFYFGQFDLLGTTMGSPRDFAGLLDLVKTGAVRPPLIGERFELRDAAAAHTYLESGEGFGKIVLEHV
jgi:NADPH:quinone reductase-like Zn-dependent oxidoreductase